MLVLVSIDKKIFDEHLEENVTVDRRASQSLVLHEALGVPDQKLFKSMIRVGTMRGRDVVFAGP
jgi:hypothetical protein